MKKILLILLMTTFIFSGCENMKNTPTNKVEEFLASYQRIDSSVEEELKNIISKDTTMNEEQQAEYQRLLEKQYQNLSYKITNETINENKATVDVEIEVYDYETAINTAQRNYLEQEKNSIEEETNEETETKVNEINNYIDYKLKEINQVNSKKKYDLTFNLTKEKGIWNIEELSDEDLKKIHGLF